MTGTADTEAAEMKRNLWSGRRYYSDTPTYDS